MENSTPDILIISGSPRRGGNTDTLCAEVAAGAQGAGANVETVRVHGLDLSPCLGCGGCAKTGTCVVADAMTPLYALLDQVRVLVIASPIYFYALSAQTKIFIDRLQACWSARHLLGRGGAGRPAPGRRGYLVAVAATRGEQLFTGARLCARYAFDALGMAYGGDLLVRGMDARNAVAADTETRARARAFGREMVRVPR